MAENYRITLMNGEEKLGGMDMMIIVDDDENIKQAYSQTKQRFLYFFFFGYSNGPSLTRIAHFGTAAVKEEYVRNNFVWVYKNIFVKVDNNKFT